MFQSEVSGRQKYFQLNGEYPLFVYPSVPLDSSFTLTSMRQRMRAVPALRANDGREGDWKPRISAIS
jgi:hypothetical protein